MNEMQQPSGFPGFESATRQILEKSFPAEQIRHDVVRAGDGFDPVYVEAANVISRLNEAFESAWSFVILKYEFIPPAGTPNQVIVHGQLSVPGLHENDGPIIKQQFGSCFLRLDRQKQFVDIGSDLKAAATDSLKKCATLFGVALTLYHRDESPMQGLHRRGPGAPEQGSYPAVQADPVSRAMEFQVAEVNKLFERLGVAKAQWMQALGFTADDQIQVQHVNQLLSGQHSYVQHLCAQQGVRTGLQASAA